ncbi:hypothetical protein C4D60_Mb02t17990 [Musa balbisiana]|uniref:Uncharacterized protein n=1 Tax=Musa balbisiana TaxID=52838 RepID=A0A4S8IBI4_MUSBA|nr:hypothetical protein C4D60_Mb02t17990 [Musa balbisiana]
MYTARPLSVFKNSAGAGAIQPPPPPSAGGLVRERRRGDPGRRRIWIGGSGGPRERRREGGRKAERAKPRVWASLWAPMPDSPSPEKNMAPGAFRRARAKSNMNH